MTNDQLTTAIRAIDEQIIHRNNEIMLLEVTKESYVQELQKQKIRGEIGQRVIQRFTREVVK